MQSCLVPDRTRSKIYNMNTAACQLEMEISKAANPSEQQPVNISLSRNDSFNDILCKGSESKDDSPGYESYTNRTTTEWNKYSSFSTDNAYKHMPAIIVNEMEPNELRRSSEISNSDLSLGDEHYSVVARNNSALSAHINSSTLDNKSAVISIESQKHSSYPQFRNSVNTTLRKKGRLINLTNKRKVAPMPQFNNKREEDITIETSSTYDVSDAIKDKEISETPVMVLPQPPCEATKTSTIANVHDPILESSNSEFISRAESTSSFSSWTNPDYLQENVVIERLSQDIYEKNFYGQEHVNYIGRDKILGPLCISLMNPEQSAYYEAIVRGKFLSVHLEIYPEELSQALTHIGVESKQPDQYNKNLALTGVLKCYIDYLKEGIPNIQELIKDADHRSCASETEVLVDVKDGITLGSGKHLKRLVESELRCLRSKPNQASIDGISDAIRRLDLAMVRKAHYIDVPLADDEVTSTQDALKDILGLTDILDGSSNSLEEYIEECPPAQITSNDLEKRAWTIQELLVSESNYVKSLGRLEKIFSWLQKEMHDNKNFLSVKFEIGMIFGNISEIYQKHVEFAKDIKQRKNEIEISLGEILEKNFKNFAKAYYHYLSDRSQAIRTHQKLFSSNTQYKNFIESLEGPTYASAEKISLSGLLIEPVQRIPRYTMLIDEILKHTSSDHCDYKNLLLAKASADEIATLHETEEEKAARMLSHIIHKVKNCPSTLLKPNRRVIAHVDAQEIDILNGKAVRYVTIILFNDAIAVFKRVSNNTNGKFIFPVDSIGSGVDRTLRRQHSVIFPGAAANRYVSSSDSYSGFKYKSCIELVNVDIFIPRGSAVDQNGKPDDIIYIRTSRQPEDPADDDGYFSVECLKQYVIRKDSNAGESFINLFHRNKAVHSAVSQGEQPTVLKSTIGPADLYFCFRSKEQYENSRTKNPVALYFSPHASYNYTPPTTISTQGLVYIEKNDNKYRSVLSTSIAALESSKDDAEDGPLVLQQVTRSLNDASGNRYHRRKPFTSLLYRQIIYMETAILCHRTVTNEETSYMLETLVGRFSSKLQKSLQTSFPWRQNHLSRAVITPPKSFRLSLKASKKVIVASTADGASENEKTITAVTLSLNGKSQPLITPLEYLWDVRPIYETVPPSPYQKRQIAKPFAQRSIKLNPDDPTTNWNSMRLNNDSNISVASKMSTMSSLSVFSVCSRMSARSRISINFTGARTKRVV